MASISELIVRIGGDTAGLESMLDRLARPFRNLQNTTRQFTSNAQNSFNNMSSRINNNVQNMTSRISNRMQNIRSRINDALSGRNPAFNQFVLNCGRMSQNVQRFAQNGIRQLRNFGRGVANASKQLKDMAKNAGTKLSGIGQSMTMGLSTPIALAGGYMVKSAADFESALSSIKSVTGATGTQMGKIKALALDMGAKTKYSALEAAGGIEELLKAGISLEDVLSGGLEGALSLATAGELELADAAELASTVLNAFKKDGLSVAKAADILAGAANASATSVGELKFGLAACSAVASGVGLTFKDTSTALAVFAQNGLKGSDAGTSLKTMLLNLTPNTEKATEIFENLGLMVYNTKDAFKFLQKAGLKPASDKLEDVRAAFGKLAEQMDEGEVGTAKNAKAVKNFMSQYSSSAFYDAKGNLKDLASISDILRKKLEKMTPEKRQTTLKDMFGTDAIRAANILYAESGKGVKKMAKDMSKVKAVDVAKERLNNFNGALENLKGSIETIAIDMGMMMLPFLKQLAEVAGEVVNIFGKAPKPFKQFVVIFGLILAVLGPVVMAIGGLLTLFGTIAIPVGIAVAAVAGFVAAVVAMGQKAGIFTMIKQKFTQIWVEVQKTFALIKPYIMTFISWIMPYIKNNMGFIKTIIGLAMDNLYKVIKIINAAIKGDWKGVWENIKGIFFNILKQIGVFISWVMNSYKGIFSVGWKLIKAVFKIALDLLVKFIVWAWGRIKTNTYAQFAAIRNVIVTAWNRVKTSTYNLWSSIYNGIKSKISSIKNTVSGMMTSIKNTISSVVSKAYNWGANLIGGFLRGIKSKVKAVKESVMSVAGIVEKYIGCNSPADAGPLADLYEWGKGLTEGYAKGMSMNENLIKKASIQTANLARAELDTTSSGVGNSFIYNQNGPVLDQRTINMIANMMTRKLRTGGA